MQGWRPKLSAHLCIEASMEESMSYGDKGLDNKLGLVHEF